MSPYCIQLEVSLSSSSYNNETVKLLMKKLAIASLTQTFLFAGERIRIGPFLSQILKADVIPLMACRMMIASQTCINSSVEGSID
mmetsp:Transcript_52207/g.126114  ORF Transcript_52207/g.126114 Transcript_52207/m.126114 type:complete len:85 (-) Transcript_52207:1330-1584(-)